MFAERFLRDGYLVVDRLFDPALIDAVREEFERQHPSIDPDRPPEHLKVGHRRLQVPIQLTGALLDPRPLENPLLVGFLKPLLGDGMVIDSVICVVALPGAEEQRVHRDNPDLFDQAIQLPPFAITVAVPLIDLTEETGTTQLFPGTHRAVLAEDGTPVDLPEAERPYVARGGCMLFDYHLWHQGTPNRSAASRPILYMTFTRPWFTDQHNMRRHAALSLDREALRQIPGEHRRLFQRGAARGRLDMTVEDFLAGE